MDSGVGGLPYLEKARVLLPAESFVYLADSAGFPYGTKSGEEIVAIVLDRVGRLVARFAPKAVVIACNTASQAALAQARKAFPGLIVVGTVPAVKPAAERSRSGVIGVMATAKAVGDPYLDALVARHAQGRTVLREAAQELVSFVERRLPGSTAEERRAAVLPHVERLVAAGADEIVLACTHFLHVADDIAACAASLAPGRGVEVVDSRDGVARRLKVLLSESGLAAAPSGSAPVKGSAPSMGAAKGAGREAAKEAGPPAGRDLFLLSSEPPFDGVYDSFARLYGLRGPEALGKS